MRPRIGEAAASLSMYDWALTLGAYALGVVALQLNAPLWAAAIVAFSGSAIVGTKHTFRNLGLLGDHGADEPTMESSSTAAASATRPARPTQPAAARSK